MKCFPEPSCFLCGVHPLFSEGSLRTACCHNPPLLVCPLALLSHPPPLRLPALPRIPSLLLLFSRALGVLCEALEQTQKKRGDDASVPGEGRAGRSWPISAVSAAATLPRSASEPAQGLCGVRTQTHSFTENHGRQFVGSQLASPAPASSLSSSHVGGVGSEQVPSPAPWCCVPPPQA